MFPQYDNGKLLSKTEIKGMDNTQNKIGMIQDKVQPTLLLQNIDHFRSSLPFVVFFSLDGRGTVHCQMISPLVHIDSSILCSHQHTIFCYTVIKFTHTVLFIPFFFLFSLFCSPFFSFAFSPMMVPGLE